MDTNEQLKIELDSFLESLKGALKANGVFVLALTEEGHCLSAVVGPGDFFDALPHLLADALTRLGSYEDGDDSPPPVLQ